MLIWRSIVGRYTPFLTNEVQLGCKKIGKMNFGVKIFFTHFRYTKYIKNLFLNFHPHHSSDMKIVAWFVIVPRRANNDHDTYVIYVLLCDIFYKSYGNPNFAPFLCSYRSWPQVKRYNSMWLPTILNFWLIYEDHI